MLEIVNRAQQLGIYPLSRDSKRRAGEINEPYDSYFHSQMKGYTHHTYYEHRGYVLEKPQGRRKHCHRTCTRTDGWHTCAHPNFPHRRSPVDCRIGYRSNGQANVQGELSFPFRSGKLACISRTRHGDLNICNGLSVPFEMRSHACRRHTCIGPKVEQCIYPVVP